ncbi:hypothetical protein AMJ86_01415 [bacterium SM23_57]|nr:MAG: hypothetical protein AMJ86_01415 [bacterium SM23_57]
MFTNPHISRFFKEYEPYQKSCSKIKKIDISEIWFADLHERFYSKNPMRVLPSDGNAGNFKLKQIVCVPWDWSRSTQTILKMTPSKYLSSVKIEYKVSTIHTSF